MLPHYSLPHSKPLPHTRALLIAAAVACLTVIHSVRAEENLFAKTNLDSAFATGFATLKQAAGFTEDPPHQASTDWQPNLQLWVGVKAVEGTKRTIYFVQLTTLLLPTNSLGPPWQPGLRTNHWSWSPSNHNEFVTALYPVRARVFDETGRQIQEGQTPMAWGMLTNGLMDMCRLGFEANRRDQSEPGGQSRPPAGKKSGTTNSPPSDELMRAMGGGFLWMIGMFSDLQTVPAVADVWAKAQCAFRWPSLWTVAKSVFTGLTLSMEPRLKEVTVINATAVGDAAPLYCLPVEVNSDKRNLTRVEIIVGPAHGAEMLLAGIRSIHARHPTKRRHEFLAQVLATGMAREATFGNSDPPP